MRLANVGHLGVKELRSLVRDPILLLLIIYAFSISVYTTATAMPQTLNKAPIVVVNEDRSPLSWRIVDAFQPPYFLRPELIDHAQMDAQLDAGRATFALDIPPGFQRDVLAGRAPALQLNVDATRMSQGFTGAGYIQRIVDDEVQAFVRRYRDAAAPLVDLELRARFNPQLDKSWFGAVMRVIDNITMLAIVLTGAALIREREHGTIEHLLVMPLTPFEIMASKVWSMALVVLAATACALTLVVQVWLQVPVQGSLALFLSAAALHLFAATAMGIFLGTLARSMPQLGLLLMLVLLPLQMLSGGSTPRENMPELVQTVMLAAPTTHFVTLAQAVLFRGAGAALVWPQMLAIAGIGALFFVVALRRMRGTLAALG